MRRRPHLVWCHTSSLSVRNWIVSPAQCQNLSLLHSGSRLRRAAHLVWASQWTLAAAAACSWQRRGRLHQRVQVGQGAA